jgi:hypothetical protein
MVPLSLLSFAELASAGERNLRTGFAAGPDSAPHLHALPRFPKSAACSRRRNLALPPDLFERAAQLSAVPPSIPDAKYLIR